jgi:hypothetical protein
MTYRRATERGGHVRKGEKGSPVVYANSITRNESGRAASLDAASPPLTSAASPRPLVLKPCFLLRRAFPNESLSRSIHQSCFLVHPFRRSASTVAFQ